MRKLAVAAAMVVSLGGVQAALAVSAPPTKAASFITWMVRAYDQCSPMGLTVLGGGGAAACIAANAGTDDDSTVLGATMKFAKITVRRFPGVAGGLGRVKVIGRGFKVGQRIQVQLTLRTTRTNRIVKHPPGTGKTVTFVDTTIVCGNNNVGCFVARPSGAVAGTETLQACLAQSGASASLGSENIQIVDAALLNCDTGKIFAVPGVLN